MAKESTCQLQGHTHDHEHSLKGELMAHLPYAIAAIAVGLIILSFLDFFSPQGHIPHRGAHVLFHSFHFLHIIFAATGTLITYLRFSRNKVMALIVAVISSLIFCTLSDIILPYVAGTLFGIDMHMHLCIVSEVHNILPFLVVGLINGFVMSHHDESIKVYYSITSHFSHILVSSLASLFYIVSEGFSDWHDSMGLLFVLLIIAVVVPCTLADLVVPMVCAKLEKKR